jgi:hypothetical protein
MQRTKNFSHKNDDEQLLSQTQKQTEVERQLEQKSECQVIDGNYNVALETWKAEGLTHFQILRNGLSKGTYGRLSYRGNPQFILSDLTRALTLTCNLQFETASQIASELIDKLKVYEKETFQKMKQEREQMMRKQ